MQQKAKHRPFVGFLLPLAGIFLAGSVALAAEPINAIATWVRPAGNGEAASQAPRRSIDLDKFAATVAPRRDPQYGRLYAFRMIPLAAVIEAATAPPDTDLALLHFANGMVVPWPLRDVELGKRLDPWIARAIMVGGQSRPLPPVTRKLHEYVDVPAIAFTGNKIVVKEAFHPAVAAAAQPAFSPWANADTLVAIEFVTSRPYYTQFDVDPDPVVREGLSLFKQNCQFCHGARHVGAKHGWDFVDPEPLYTYRASPTRLYYHVRFARPNAVERGSMMPALKHMTAADAQSLWTWLKAIGTRPMPGYQPRLATR